MKLSTISLRYLKGQKKHTVMSIIAIITATAFLTVILSGLSVYRAAALNVCRETNGTYHILFNGLDKTQLMALRSMDIFEDTENYSVSSYTASTSVDYGQMKKDNARMEYLLLDGEIVEDVFLRVKEGGIKMMPDSMSSVTVGRLPEKDGELVLSSKSSSMWGFPELGDTVYAVLVTCSAEGENENIPEGVPEALSDAFFIEGTDILSFTVVGFSESTNMVSYDDTRLKSYSYLTDNLLARFSDKTNDLYWDLHYAFADAGYEIDDFSYGMNQELLDLEGKGVTAKFSQALFFGVMYLAVLFIMFCVRMVIDNSFEISAKERIKQFGLLKAVGASKKQVFSLVIWEAIYLAIPGVIIGILAGTGCAALIFGVIKSLPNLNSEINNLGSMLVFELKPYVFITSAFIGVFWVVISAISTGMRSIRSSPVEAMRDAGKQEKIRVPKFGSGLEKHGFTAAYSGLSIKRNKRRYIITMVSMVMSIVLFSSFSYGIEIYRNKLAADFDIDRDPYDYSIKYTSMSTEDALWVTDQMKASGLFDSVMYDSMIQTYISIADLNAVSGTRISELEGMFFEIHPVSRSTYEKDIRSDIPYDRLETELILLIDSQHRDQKGSNPYRIIDTPPQSVSVAAYIPNNNMIIDPVTVNTGGTYTTDNRMYYSCENTVKAIASENVYEYIVNYIGLDSCSAKIDVNENTSYVLFTRNICADAAAGKAAEAKNFLDRHFYDSYTDNASEKANSLAVLEMVRVLGYFIIGIIAVIAAVNIVNIISSNVLNRTSEFAMLRACGMSDKQLSKMILYESMIYAAIAAFSSLLVVEAAILIVQIPFKTHFHDLTFDDIGFEFSAAAPLKYILAASAASFIIAAAASWAPAQRIIKTPIVENIRSMEN